ncbi:MAG: flagellar assembly protein A [Desulfobacteraceae bacterium]
MDAKGKHRVLVVEASDKLRQRLDTVLVSQGFEVTCETTAASALERLASAEPLFYTLIVSSYQMPEMKGDEILKKAGEAAPETLRMLIADASDFETMVNAVNIADVHACFLLPVNETDFVVQVNQCCDQFEKTRELENLKKMTRRQNRQMFKMAEELKKKDTLYRKRIKKIKQQIRIHKTAQRNNDKNNEKNEDSPDLVSLETLLSKNGIVFTSENLEAEFLSMADQLKIVFTRVLKNSSGSMEALDFPLVLKEDSNDKSLCEKAVQLMSLFFMLMDDQKKAASQESDGCSRVEDMLELTLSDNRTKAFVRIKTYNPDMITVDSIKDFLDEQEIRFGLADDKLISAWLADPLRQDSAFVIAEGKSPKLPKNAEISYSFPTDYLKAGRVNKDGSIDFKERGDIPFVEKGMLLASKLPAEEGVPGRDVYGMEIPVSKASDLLFSSGIGTIVSEDNLKIYADNDGQPYLDPMGVVSVFPELNIKGDVGFETGNIKYNGNIVVHGIVKEGFSVKGASLTVSQIEGAEIELTGDLNVSAGIIDAHLIKVQGSVQAKYVNNSKIEAFGDLIVQKEIIDSVVLLSGACVNTQGKMLSSAITARKGVYAGQIGTDMSQPVKIKVGGEDHINFLMAQVKDRLDRNLKALEKLRADISDLEAEDKELNVKITEQAYLQDRTQLELDAVKEKLSGLNVSGNVSAVQKVTKAAEKMHRMIKQAEDTIKGFFSRQDSVADEISGKKKKIKAIEKSNKTLVYKKKGLREFSEKSEPQAELKINKRAMPGTIIKGPHSSVTLKDPVSRCIIREVKKHFEDDHGTGFYEMETSFL